MFGLGKGTTQETNTEVMNNVENNLKTYITNSNKLQDIVEKNFTTMLKNNIKNSCKSITNINQIQKYNINVKKDIKIGEIGQKAKIDAVINCINNGKFCAKVLEDMGITREITGKQDGKITNTVKTKLDSETKLKNVQKIGSSFGGIIGVIILLLIIRWIYKKHKKNKKKQMMMQQQMIKQQ